MLELFILFFGVIFVLVYDDMKIPGLIIEFIGGLPERFIKLIRNRVKNNNDTPDQEKVEITVRKDEEIYDDPCFKSTVEMCRRYWRWMTLAGGTDPIIHPSISFGDDGTIYLSKQGYDLWTGNWKDYKDAKTPVATQKSLEGFERDLFGDYAGKVKISMEYIADHLIDIENEDKFTSDFILSFSYPGGFKTGKEKYFFVLEMQKTNIFEIDQ